MCKFMKFIIGTYAAAVNFDFSIIFHFMILWVIAVIHLFYLGSGGPRKWTQGPMRVKQVQFHGIISPVLHPASCICAACLKNVCTYLFTLLLKHLLMFNFLMGNISWVRVSVGCLFRHRVARLCTRLYLKCYLLKKKWSWTIDKFTPRAWIFQACHSTDDRTHREIFSDYTWPVSLLHYSPSWPMLFFYGF